MIIQRFYVRPWSLINAYDCKLQSNRVRHPVNTGRDFMLMSLLKLASWNNITSQITIMHHLGLCLAKNPGNSKRTSLLSFISEPYFRLGKMFVYSRESYQTFFHESHQEFSANAKQKNLLKNRGRLGRKRPHFLIYFFPPVKIWFSTN